MLSQLQKKTNGTAIIDGYNSLYTDSKNIKKFLEAYHKDGGAVSFEHLFMEDGEFKYQLVTRDGEQFLKFIDSDGFSSSLKKYLTSNTKSSSPQILARLKLEDYLTSLELNLFSFFAKAGTIRGNSNSALEKAVLLQSGFDRRFLTPNLKNAFLNAFFGNKIIDVNGSFIFGDIQKENGIITPVKGVTGNLFFSTNNEKGLNLGIGISANDAWITGLNSFLVEDILLFDISCRAGLSYTFKGEKIELKPYFIQEFSFFPTHVSIGDYELKPSELTAGGIIALKPLGNDDFKVSLEPYYTGRIWENEFGGNIGIEARGNKIGVNGYFSKSKYDFAPDRFGIGVESELSLKNFYIKLIELGLNVSYGLEGTNYDGETDLKHNLGVSATIKH